MEQEEKWRLTRKWLGKTFFWGSLAYWVQEQPLYVLKGR